MLLINCQCKRAFLNMQLETRSRSEKRGTSSCVLCSTLHRFTLEFKRLLKRIWHQFQIKKKTFALSLNLDNYNQFITFSRKRSANWRICPWTGRTVAMKTVHWNSCGNKSSSPYKKQPIARTLLIIGLAIDCYTMKKTVDYDMKSTVQVTFFVFWEETVCHKLVIIANLKKYKPQLAMLKVMMN